MGVFSQGMKKCVPVGIVRRKKVEERERERGRDHAPSP
jgi:hypothetical protein